MNLAGVVSSVKSGGIKNGSQCGWFGFVIDKGILDVLDGYCLFKESLVQVSTPKLCVLFKLTFLSDQLKPDNWRLTAL